MSVPLTLDIVCVRGSYRYYLIYLNMFGPHVHQRNVHQQEVPDLKVNASDFRLSFFGSNAWTIYRRVAFVSKGHFKKCKGRSKCVSTSQPVAAYVSHTWPKNAHPPSLTDEFWDGHMSPANHSASLQGLTG